jgi:hypothetical protein
VLLPSCILFSPAVLIFLLKLTNNENKINDCSGYLEDLKEESLLAGRSIFISYHALP